MAPRECTGITLQIHLYLPTYLPTTMGVASKSSTMSRTPVQTAQELALAVVPILPAALAQWYPRVLQPTTVFQQSQAYLARRYQETVADIAENLDTGDDDPDNIRLNVTETMNDVTQLIQTAGCPLVLVVDIEDGVPTALYAVKTTAITPDQRTTLIQMSSYYLLAENDPIIDAYDQARQEWITQGAVLQVRYEDIFTVSHMFSDVYRQEYTRSNLHPAQHLVPDNIELEEDDGEMDEE